MCGIAGIFTSEAGTPASAHELRRMASSIAHRGPDGYGTYLDDRTGLAHTRLAILDREGGDQPLSNEDGSVWVTFNGEIFNYVELREALERAGHRFRTRSDTEVIVHAYEEWGPNAWRRFNGQFAFAIRDRREQCLWLVRDRVGIAPLFVARTPNAVIFGSEAKAIFASRRVRPKADPASLIETFTLWATPGPATVFAGVNIVAPGTALRFDESLGERAHRYHSQRFEVDPSLAAADPQELAEELQARLRTAIRLRLRADVPVGAYLSGGLDSSVVTKLVRLIDTSELQTFSVRFEDPRYDEGRAQQRMASELGTTHHEVIATPELLASELPRVIAHCETPLLRTAPVPMFLLSSLVRRLGMRVVLTGEGADEFLGGYDIFKEDRVRRFWARAPESTARPMLFSRVHPYVANATSGAMWQAFFRRGLGATDDPFYAHRLRWENSAWTTRFLSADVRASLSAEAIDARIHAASPPGWDAGGPLERAQQTEITTFMSAYLLASQGDRALMANAVEGRFPFLDPEVVDFCSGLPRGRKLCGLREKTILRRVARTLLPAEIAERRKWPYRAPIAPALFGPDAPALVRELLSPRAIAESSLLDARAAGTIASRALADVAHVGEREEMALVGILTLQLWQRAFLNDVPEGTLPANEPRVQIDLRSRSAAPQPISVTGIDA